MKLTSTSAKSKYEWSHITSSPHIPSWHAQETHYLYLYLRNINKQPNVGESCVLLCCYVACSGNSLSTFRDNLSVPFTRDPWKWDHYLVPNSRQEITSMCWARVQKSAVLVYFAGKRKITHTRVKCYRIQQINTKCSTYLTTENKPS
jgi:hypothetical protein